MPSGIRATEKKKACDQQSKVRLMVVDGYEYKRLLDWCSRATTRRSLLFRLLFFKVEFLLLTLNRALRSKIIHCGEGFSELCSKLEETVHFISTLPPQCSTLMSLSPTYEFI